MSNLKDIDDVDDDTFISKKPKKYIFAETKKANDIQERTAQMLLNSRALVQETETIGQSTLENLSSQRETLERVEDDLDNINSMTRATQKHLNNMRSFFGGFKSLFGSSSSSASPAVVANSRGVPRSATIAQMSTAGSSTSSGSQLSSNSNSSSSNNNNINNQTKTSATTLPQVTSDKRDKPDDEFEPILSELGFGLGRLKDMAMKLGDEIGDQNDMLDRITDKSERAGDSIKHQNRQMSQLVKK